MEEYLSEKEQIEQVRGWFRENAPWALTGILIGVGGLLGWQQYQGWLDRKAAHASDRYTATLEALGHGDVDGAGRIVAELRSDGARTPYPDLAALAVARYAVETGKLADAARYLGEVIGAGRDPELVLLARLRLARVQRADGKVDEAMKTLADGGEAGSAAPAFAELRGDLLADKGDKAGALAAWREALAATATGLVNRDLVELKVAALGVGAPAPVAGGNQP